MGPPAPTSLGLCLLIIKEIRKLGAWEIPSRAGMLGLRSLWASGVRGADPSSLPAADVWLLRLRRPAFPYSFGSSVKVTANWLGTEY